LYSAFRSEDTEAIVGTYTHVQLKDVISNDSPDTPVMRQPWVT